MRKNLGWAVTAAASLLAVATQPVFAQTGRTGVIKIGINESLSGSFVAAGQPPAAAAKMAAKEINDRGGIVVGGVTYKFEVIEVDNQSQTASAVAGMTRLVDDEKIKFVFGPTVSTFATQTSALTVPAKVMQFSAATSWQASGYLSDASKPLLFGVQLPASRVTEIDASAFKLLGATKVTYLSQDDDVTKATWPSFHVPMKAANIGVSLTVFPVGTNDYSSYVSRAKGEGVEGIYLGWPQSLVREVLRTVVDLNAGPKAFGGRALDPNAALKTAIGKPVPVPFFSTGLTPSFDYPPNAKVKAFTERIKAFAPNLPNALINGVFYTYDVFYMLAEAMKQAGTVEDTAKLAALMGNMTYDGVAGKVCFGKEIRTVMYDGGLLLIKDGKVESRSIPSTCK